MSQPSLLEIMQERSADPLGSAMINNLRAIVDVHCAVSPDVLNSDIDKLRLVQEYSALPDPALRQDRDAEELAQKHDLDIHALRAFVGGQVVIDFGSGSSTFLSAFNDATTVAIDLNPSHRRYQETMGHRAETSLEAIRESSAQLIHDSYASYWTPSEADAVSTASAIKRVLSRQGVLLTGAIFAGYHHVLCEKMMRKDATVVSPPYGLTNDHLNDVLSYIRLIFVHQFLADPQYQVTGTRYIPPHSPYFRDQQPPSHALPNFLAITKL